MGTCNLDKRTRISSLFSQSTVFITISKSTISDLVFFFLDARKYEHDARTEAEVESTDPSGDPFVAWSRQSLDGVYTVF